MHTFMFSIRNTCLLLISFLLLVGSSSAQSDLTDVSATEPFIPSAQNRMVAEWEPAVGVLVSWPPAIPQKLIQELAKDTKLYLMIKSRVEMQKAIQYLTKWGIMPDQVRFITSPQSVDISWTRDWGPHAAFDTQGVMFLGDAKYIYSTPVSGYACDDSLRFLFYDGDGNIEPTITEDRNPLYVGASVNLDVRQLPFVFTGGNVFADGQRTGFSSCVILNENQYINVSEEDFRSDVSAALGLSRYNILSNFEERGIQHIDCFMKMLDEERLLVMRPPADHPSSAVYEGIVEHELSQLTNAYGRPYQILRLDTDVYGSESDPYDLAAYSNSLILNKVIYVPLFGIAQDSVALRQWREAMPGYQVKGFEFVIRQEPFLSQHTKEHYGRLGWNGGDALHCRTRAIWDPNMIYMSADRIPAFVQKAQSYPLDVIIKDYSSGTLDLSSLKVYWRVKGGTKWKSESLKPTSNPDHFSASIPGKQAGVTIQYYIQAASDWGNLSTLPRVVPEAYYEFTIN